MFLAVGRVGRVASLGGVAASPAVGGAILNVFDIVKSHLSARFPVLFG